jgi:hypothetical protein
VVLVRRRFLMPGGECSGGCGFVVKEPRQRGAACRCNSMQRMALAVAPKPVPRASGPGRSPAVACGRCRVQREGALDVCYLWAPGAALRPQLRPCGSVAKSKTVACV